MPLGFYQTDIGRIGIEEQQEHITKVYFDNEPLDESIELMSTSLTNEAAKQLSAYLSGRLKQFSLPLAPIGSVFRQTLWQLLCAIPYGETASYKSLAIAAGNANAARAVGQANNKNPIPIFIPCHRVIGANGQLVGYRGGLAIKQHLLQIEKQSRMRLEPGN